MNKLITFLMLLAVYPVYAQPGLSCSEARQQSHKRISAKIALASPFLDFYDVKYVKLDLAMSHLNTALSGNAITKAVVVNPAGMDKYFFELTNVLTIDSVRVNGMTLPHSNQATGLHYVTLPSPLPPGTPFTAQVFYHGVAQNGGNTIKAPGVHHAALTSGTNITYTCGEYYSAKDWWPCKQSLTDKIDSADLWFTVPNTAKAGSNGLLRTTTPVGLNNTRYEWKTAYPIDFYLISTAIAPYTERRQTVHFAGSTDTMPVQHYLYDTAKIASGNLAMLDSTAYFIELLSGVYGRYPFWKEKYGHCLIPANGGMEHQTMTSLGSGAFGAIVHELGHQWWGDHVTFASWKDIWLSEGMATYTESLLDELWHGAALATTGRVALFNRVENDNVYGSVYVDDTTNESRIFSYPLSYAKGAAVVHMLRYIAPSDASFFQGLRNYQQQYAFGVATTEDFRHVLEATFGHSLDTFFSQWIYGQGYPEYAYTWNQIGNTVFVRVIQTTTRPAIVPVFSMPLELRLLSSSGDTVVKVYNDRANQVYSFTWNQTMTGASVDPNHSIVRYLPSAGNTHDPSLAVSPAQKSLLRIFPNPATNTWQVTDLPSRAFLSLYNAAGSLIWQHTGDGRPQVQIPARSLPAGLYLLEVRDQRDIVTRQMLEKR